MHIWLIQTGEPLPIDPGNPRLLRTGLLAAELVRRGHRVTWWATTFEHGSKRRRAAQNTEVVVSPGLRLLLVHSPGYSSNVSLRRFLDHRALGRNFRRWMREEARPDVVHCGFPTIETAFEATLYAREQGIPCVVDARDMWPDIYLEAFPKPFRPLLRTLIHSDFQMTRAAFHRATAITAHTPAFVEWALRYAGRARSAKDRDFPFAYPVKPPDDAALAEAKRFWEGQGLSDKPGDFVVCFFGTFAARREVDVRTVIEAARALRVREPRVKFILCGAGPAAERYRSMARDLPNVVMPGWMDAPRIWMLMRYAQIGLLPYLPSVDFAASLPNKSIEYLSAGLPILTCLRGGYLEAVLQRDECGTFYAPGDPQSLVDAVIRVSSSPAVLARQRASAAALFNARFRQDVVYSAMVDYLEGFAREGCSVNAGVSGYS